MSRPFWCAGLLLALVAAPAARASSLQVSFSETSNLAYQLDCLSRVSNRCARAPFRAAWKQLGWTAADDDALRQWKAISDRYDASVTLEPRPNAPFPFDGRSVHWSEKLRIAETSAGDPAGLARNLGLVVSDDDAQALLAIYGRFAPRFHRWWRAGPARSLAAFASATHRLIATAQLERFDDQVARLYGAPPDEQFRIHLVAVPSGRFETHGEQFESHATVEVRPREAPKERVDVVLHETFHVLFRRAAATRQRLEARFAASKDPDALAAWDLLDEALATAIGNGLVAERVHSDQLAHRLATAEGLYDDPFIDAMAKALIPGLRQRLAEGGTLDERFFDQYLALAHRTLGERLRSPGVILKASAIVCSDDALEPVADSLIDGIKPRSIFFSSPLDAPQTRERLERFPKLPGAVLVTTGALDQLAGWDGVLGATALAKLRARAKQQSSFVERVQCGSGAPVWIFVAPDSGGLAALVKRFVAEIDQPTR